MIPVDVACGVAVSVHALRFYVADLAVGNGAFGVHGLGRERKVDDYLQLLAVRLCFFYFDGRHGGYDAAVVDTVKWYTVPLIRMAMLPVAAAGVPAA